MPTGNIYRTRKEAMQHGFDDPKEWTLGLCIVVEVDFIGRSKTKYKLPTKQKYEPTGEIGLSLMGMIPLVVFRRSFHI